MDEIRTVETARIFLTSVRRAGLRSAMVARDETLTHGDVVHLVAIGGGGGEPVDVELLYVEHVIDKYDKPSTVIMFAVVEHTGSPLRQLFAGFGIEPAGRPGDACAMTWIGGGRSFTTDDALAHVATCVERARALFSGTFVPDP